MSEKFNPAFLANCVRIETTHTTPEAADELRRLIVHTLETQVKAYEADPCDATWEEAQAGADFLDLTILWDPLYPDTENVYVEAWVSFGGPNVWIERGPRDRHYTIHAVWGSDRAHLVDEDDFLEPVFADLIAGRMDAAAS